MNNLSIRRRIIRKINAVLGLHPSSYPYISGDGFRAMATHRHEKGSPADPSAVSDGDIVFVESDLIKDFFTTVHPRIASRYVLVSHNSDTNIGVDWIRCIDDKIIRWFAQNTAVRHPKIVPLPIGLENARYADNGIPSVFKKLSVYSLAEWKNIHKDPCIVLAFSIDTNREARQPIADKLKDSSMIDFFPTDILADKPPITRLNRLKRAMFAISPPGNGMDCHRTWEALYVGTIPIVVRSPSTEYWKGLGLPLWIVNDWNELKRFDEAGLTRKYIELTNGASLDTAWFGYWKSAIESAQKEIV
jgi:hypothetical protein